MKLSYDPKANVAYIRFRAGQGQVETIELTLNANEQLTAGDDGKLVFVNQLNGEHGELKVA